MPDRIGIVCPKCECPDLRVVRTLKTFGEKIRRERVCQNHNCGHKFITTETTARSVADAPPPPAPPQQSQEVAH